MMTLDDVLRLADEISPPLEELRPSDLTIKRYVDARCVSERTARRILDRLEKSGKFYKIKVTGNSGFAWRLVEKK